MSFTAINVRLVGAQIDITRFALKRQIKHFEDQGLDDMALIYYDVLENIGNAVQLSEMENEN